MRPGLRSSESAEDALIAPFFARVEGAWRHVPGLSDERSVKFPSGLERPVYRTSLADGITLAQSSGARDVSVRLGVDDATSFRWMRALMRAGVWSRMQRVPALKRALAPKERKGAPHEIVVEVRGRDASGEPAARRASILDRRGQSHLTAIGALFGIERIAGLGMPAMRPGIAVPETGPMDPARLLTLLREESVAVTSDLDPSRAS